MKEILDRLSDRLAQLRESQPGAVNGPVAAVAIVGGLLLIGVIAWASLRPAPHPPAPLPDGAPWLCKNGHVFTLTGEQLAEHNAKHAAEPVPCPVCGAPAERAVKCPHCGNVVVPGPDQLCPVCKNPILHH